MPYLAIGLTLLGYVLLMLTNPVRRSFRDGWSCQRRYPVLWRTLAWLAFANALFHFAVRLSWQWRGHGALVWLRPGWNDPGAWLTGTPDSLWWLPPASIRALLEDSILPAFEMLAGLFNNVVTTFPIAVLAAFALFFNRRRTLRLLFRSLRQRFGLAAWILVLAVLGCAMAAIAKAIFYFRPAWIPDQVWLEWAPIAAGASALFEYLFGVAIQAYLILHAYAWVRGLTFDSEAMREVAVRRVGAAAKWAGIVLLAQIVFIELPIVLSLRMGWPASPEITTDRLLIVRLVFAAVLLVLLSLQAWLTLHGETLRRAWRAHWDLLWRHAWSIGWFLIVALVHCFVLQFLRTAVLQGVGEETFPGVMWTLTWPWIFGVVAGWLLASWVCLFKRCE